MNEFNDAMTEALFALWGEKRRAVQVVFEEKYPWLPADIGADLAYLWATGGAVPKGVEILLASWSGSEEDEVREIVSGLAAALSRFDEWMRTPR